MRPAFSSTWLVIPLATIPIICLLAAGADPTWLGLGALSWIIAVE